MLVGGGDFWWRRILAEAYLVEAHLVEALFGGGAFWWNSILTKTLFAGGVIWWRYLFMKVYFDRDAYLRMCILVQALSEIIW